MSQPLGIRGITAHLQHRVTDVLRQLAVPADFVAEFMRPPDPTMGDFGFPCFALAKVLRKAPPVIAQDIAGRLSADEWIEQATADKGYVNIRLRAAKVTETVLSEVLAQRDRFGSNQVATPQHWMVEYSGPNANKPMHLGHLRNNMLGLTVANLLRFYGHRVSRINLINDRGVHICKSMLAYQRWGQNQKPGDGPGQKKGDHLVGDFYVLFENRFVEEYAAWQQTPGAKERYAQWEKSPAGTAALKAAQKKGQPPPVPTKIFFGEFKDTYFNEISPLGADVREMLRRWESDDAEVRALWRQLTTWVVEGFEATYRRMGVAFEHVQVESETYKLGKRVVEQGVEKGVFKRIADGAIVCDLTQVGLTGDKVLLRGDGTSVYMTQDLGTAQERFEKYNPDKLVFVVADEQNFHFDVLFKLLGLLRPGYAERCIHLGYGMIRLPEGKMKSRECTVVDADDLMDEMHRLAGDELRTRMAEGKAHVEDLTEQELSQRAEAIGMAALKYYLLKYSPRTSFEYDPKASIDFLGQTGPYCLFNYARTRSVLRKAGGEPPFSSATVARLSTPEEKGIIQRLSEFPEVVERSAAALDPSRIAEYCFSLSQQFAYIFTDKDRHAIATCPDNDLRNARLLLASAVGEVLRTGLGLLGIAVLDEM